jgi:hypothetical protein
VCVCCLRRAARCIMEHPAEKLFYRANTPCKTEHPTFAAQRKRGLVLMQSKFTLYTSPCNPRSIPSFFVPLPPSPECRLRLPFGPIFVLLVCWMRNLSSGSKEIWNDLLLSTNLPARLNFIKYRIYMEYCPSRHLIFPNHPPP